MGKRTVELLTQAKRRGCDVILLYDSIGSRSVNNEFLAPLRKAGACMPHTTAPPSFDVRPRPVSCPTDPRLCSTACLEFGPVRVSRFQSWRHGPFRNHQKLLIVDDHGYCGVASLSLSFSQF